MTTEFNDTRYKKTKNKAKTQKKYPFRRRLKAFDDDIHRES